MQLRAAVPSPDGLAMGIAHKFQLGNLPQYSGGRAPARPRCVPASVHPAQKTALYFVTQGGAIGGENDAGCRPVTPAVVASAEEYATHQLLRGLYIPHKNPSCISSHMAVQSVEKTV